MTGSPAGPIDAPIGSAAAEASVAAGAGAAVVVVELVELAELSGEGEDEVEDAGVDDSAGADDVGGGTLDPEAAELVVSERSID